MRSDETKCSSVYSVHDMKNSTDPKTKGNIRVYRLKPVALAQPAEPLLPGSTVSSQAQAGPPSAGAPLDEPIVQTEADRFAPVKGPLPRLQPLHPTGFPVPPAGKSVLKPGLDIDIKRITATLQWDHLNPKPARDFDSPAALTTWVTESKFVARLSATGKLPKRWAVALARQLAVDLWRVRTGRATWAELGFLEMTWNSRCVFTAVTFRVPHQHQILPLRLACFGHRVDRCPALQRSQPLGACSWVGWGAVRPRLPVSYDIWGAPSGSCSNRSWLAVSATRARSSEAHPAGDCSNGKT